ncbi:hypothetical protein MKS88_003908 [Plasmodium brasilianum]|uniref:Uncharacterized protein n=2 Tax=Plasmodium (Plasmodium) TaxID=418103 RepID=A0A1D3SN86_PLAMA|nr:conserved Plasmodium protein, unknown function [Plasmodium malariae]KAI4837434.1 hypothetical protein MKS88_003908 [Plasmodium brasilianum]SCO93318.1 conserved Plasmodium protein, unknown function [Plasmodium malariae]
MNNCSSLASNEHEQFHKTVIYKNRARSLIQQNIKSRSECHNEEQTSGGSIKDKIRRLFSSKYDQSIRDLQKTKLRINKNVHEEENNSKNLKTCTPVYDQNIEWQPVYHETCKIKLPVEDCSTKISLPDDVVDDWVHSQNKLSKELNASRIKSKPDDMDVNAYDDNYYDENSHNNNADGKANSKYNCLFNKNFSQKSYMRTNEEEPYSKFKYYYNYYLVDEYLESLAESQNKNLDATGLDENGQLYDNVSLNVKPIIMSKHRLENGVPYDPTKLMN